MYTNVVYMLQLIKWVSNFLQTFLARLGVSICSLTTFMAM